MNKILPAILLVIISFVAYAVYTQANKSIKTKRIECQSKTTTFEKISIEEPIKEAVNSLKANNYTLTSAIEYSKFMKSNLVNLLTKEQADEKLENVIKNYLEDSSTQAIPNENKLSINYYIYENDKEDKGKKNNDAKSYAGYLVFEFKYDNILVYKIQSDYMNLNGTDIEDRMNCAIKSFTSLN
jgi:mRNA-degrading endonuclease YafQ of YafQ-DinJ toxin-antitoxin module